MRGLGLLATVVLVACARPPSPAPIAVAPASAPAREVEVPVAATPPITSEAPPHELPPIPPVHTFERPKEWPAALLLPATFDPSRAVATIGEHGDLRVEHNVEHSKLADVAAAWTEALTAAGFVRREPCPDTANACVWIGNDRLLTITTASSWDGSGVDTAVHWLPVGHVAKVRLPGACVTPAVSQRVVTVHAAGIDQDGEFRQGESRWDMTNHRGPDLDGDTVPDMFVPHDSKGACPWDIPHDVYVMRGTCGHRVGTIVGQVDDVTHTSAFRKGLRQIHTSASWADHGARSAIPEHHTRERTFVFDGRRLRKASDKTRTGQCHHCGVVRCHEG